MSEIAASSKCSGHRSNWCSSCDELWVASRVVASGVDRCPACDGPVLAYMGRLPDDVRRRCANDAQGHARQFRTTDGLEASRRSPREALTGGRADAIHVS